MNITKTFQGAYQISTVKAGQSITRQYMGYTRKESITLFKQYLKTL